MHRLCAGRPGPARDGETGSPSTAHGSAARGRAVAAAARREAVAAVVRTAGLTGEAAATSGAAARGGQRRGAGERGARAMSEGRRREMEGGGDGGEGRGGGGGGGGENGGTEFVSVSGAAAGGGAAAALSLFERCFEPGIPCHCDRRARERRSRARRIHDARAIFAESGPQREAVFSADVQRRARKQAQRRRCRAAWASRVQWRGAAGSDVHRVAPRGRRSARAGQEALGRLKRTSALIAWVGGAGGRIHFVFATRLPTGINTGGGINTFPNGIKRRVDFSCVPSWCVPVGGNVRVHGSAQAYTCKHANPAPRRARSRLLHSRNSPRGDRRRAIRSH